MKAVTTLVGVCILGCALSVQGRGLQFETIEPVYQENIMNTSGVRRQALSSAMRLHNLMVDLRGLDMTRNQVMMALKTQQLQAQRLEALERCSVAKLADQFKDPEAVWKKMKDEYNRREKDLTIYINSAEPPTEDEVQAYERQLTTGEMTPEMVSELFANWQIGYDILADVYQNQDAWGERKNEKAPSFPLWRDQKAQFDKEWDETYTKINLYFGVPPQGRPIIGDERYDYARADDVEAAHAAYLAVLAAQNPLKAGALPVALQHAPVAPRPLPPKQESVVYLESDNPEKQFYPEMPAPWKKYAEDNFKTVAPDGEMAEDFASGLVLKETAKVIPHTNRLTAYAAMRDSVEGMNQVSTLVLDNVAPQLDQLRFQIAQFIDIPDDADLLDPDVQAAVSERLASEYDRLLQQADAELQQRIATNEEEHVFAEKNLEDIPDFATLKELNPEAFEQIRVSMPTSPYEQDTRLLAALKQDKDATVFINEVNAGEVDRLIQEAEATQAFYQERNTWEKDLALEAGIPIDDSCLNGGV